MTTVSAGTTGNFTFVTNDSLLLTLDAGEVASVNVSSAAGKTKFQAEIRKTQVIGPFVIGDVAKITAERGDIDYLVVSQELFGVHAYMTQEQQVVPGVTAVGVLVVGSDGQIYLPDGTISVAGSGSTTYSGLTDKATADLPTINAPLSTALGLKANQTALDATNTIVTSHTTSIGTLTSGLDAAIDQEVADVADLQSQIDGIEVSNPGAITGLVDGGVVDNAATFQSFIGPPDNSGSIIAADGMVSDTPTSGYYLVKSTVNVDGQVGMEWGTRGAVTIVPDPRIPALTPGTFNSGTRIGGFAPGSVFRMARRSPNIFKQAYEPKFSVNIDGTGVKGSGSFTCDAAGVFTASAHGRQNGDIIFFDSPSSGAALPSPLVNGDDSKYTNSYKVSSVTTNTFKVSSWNTGTNDYNAGTVTTAAGSGVWATNVAGVRIPKNSAGGSVPAGSAAMDPDQDFDDKKEYTAGLFADCDIVGMSGSGLISETGSGRLHLHSVRAIGNRLHGFDISSNDTIASGHWAAGSNGGFGVHKGSGTGFYAWGGNLWGSPTNRSLTCGAMYLRDTAYWIVGGTEFNDWGRFDGIKNFNAAGALIGNMCHPHGENFSSDGVAIDAQSSGDTRLQSHFGITGYQGLNVFGTAWSRTEGVSFNTPFNFPDSRYRIGAVDNTGLTGTAPQYTVDLGGEGPGGDAGRVSMTQIFDGVCSAPDAKPWTGPFGSVSFSIANPCVATWTGHPLVIGDRVRFHSTGTLPSHITGDTQDYFVLTVPTADTFTFSATYGGTAVNTTGDAAGLNHKVVHVSSRPYHVSGGAQTGGYYFDSFRGAHTMWSMNGVAPKIMIGLPYTGGKIQSWEGNPNYFIEIGDPTLHSGLPPRNNALGRWEFGNAVGYTANALDARTHSGGTFSDTVKAGTATFMETLSSTAFTTGQITLPSGVDIDASQALRVVVVGKSVASLTWAFTQAGGAWRSGSPTPPANVPGSGMELMLWYEKSDDKWELMGPAFSDGNLIGRIDNVSQPAGVVGESMVSKVNTGSAVSLTSTTVANITSITLTPGEWDVGANVIAVTNTASATQVTRLAAVLSTTSNSNFTSSDSTQYSIHSAATTSVSASGTDVDSLTLGKTRILVAAGTTQQVWLNVKATFTGGISAWGALSARRAT